VSGAGGKVGTGGGSAAAYTGASAGTIAGSRAGMSCLSPDMCLRVLRLAQSSSP